MTAMWIKATDAGPPAAGGRVNLDLALALLISGASAEADRLILNGS